MSPRPFNERRRQERALAQKLATDFGVTFSLALRAVRAGVAERCAELAETIGECRTRGFIAAVQTLVGSRVTRRTSSGGTAHHPAERKAAT